MKYLVIGSLIFLFSNVSLAENIKIGNYSAGLFLGDTFNGNAVNTTNPNLKNFYLNNNFGFWVKHLNKENFPYDYINFKVEQDKIVSINSGTDYKLNITHCVNLAKNTLDMYPGNLVIKIDRRMGIKYTLSKKNIYAICDTPFSGPFNLFSLQVLYSLLNEDFYETQKKNDISYLPAFENKNKNIITQLSGVNIGENLSNYNPINLYKYSIENNIEYHDFFYGSYSILSLISLQEKLNLEVRTDNNNNITNIYSSTGPANNPIFKLTYEECLNKMLYDKDRLRIEKEYHGYYSFDSQNYNIGKLSGITYQVKIYGNENQIFKILCYSHKGTNLYSYQKGLF